MFNPGNNNLTQVSFLYSRHKLISPAMAWSEIQSNVVNPKMRLVAVGSFKDGI